MQPSKQYSRINLQDLKVQIVKKLGPEDSKQYFYYLQKFLSLKLNKVDFNKLCLRILGHENISLHNHFICSILRNCVAKSPPRVSDTEDASNHGTQVGNEIAADGCQQNGFHTSTNHASCSTGLVNGGDVLPASPRKARTGTRDKRNGDRRSAMGPIGKSNFAPHLSSVSQFSENEDLRIHDVERTMHHPKSMVVLVENENEKLISFPSKLPLVRISSDDPASVDSKSHHELLEKDETKVISCESPLQAPFGVPSCPPSTGALPPARSCRCVDTFTDCALLDSLTLKERMEHSAMEQGIEGVSIECANLLNLSLDSYLRGLIGSCLGIVGARSENETNFQNKQTHMKLLNGVKPAHQLQMPNSSKHSSVQESKVISLQDFRIAMELRPRQLGEDWPLLLEKICSRAFEE